MPISQFTKQKISRALQSIPTNERTANTFNHTRAAGSVGPGAVNYLLPRLEPSSEYILLDDFYLRILLLVNVSSISIYQAIIQAISLAKYHNPDELPAVLKVDMVGEEVTIASWWEIWTAGVAVYTLCIQKGRAGVGWNLGKLA